MPQHIKFTCQACLQVAAALAFAIFLFCLAICLGPKKAHLMPRGLRVAPNSRPMLACVFFFLKGPRFFLPPILTLVVEPGLALHFGETQPVGTTIDAPES